MPEKWFELRLSLIKLVKFTIRWGIIPPTLVYLIDKLVQLIKLNNSTGITVAVSGTKGGQPKDVVFSID